MDRSSMPPLECGISSDGNFITLSRPEMSGERREFALTLDEANALAMNLPRLIGAILRERYLDNSWRHIYPLHRYIVERASDNVHLLVTMAADEGFDVVFALNSETAAALARDLMDEEERRSPVRH